MWDESLWEYTVTKVQSAFGHLCRPYAFSVSSWKSDWPNEQVAQQIRRQYFYINCPKVWSSTITTFWKTLWFVPRTGFHVSYSSAQPDTSDCVCRHHSIHKLFCSASYYNINKHLSITAQILDEVSITKKIMIIWQQRTEYVVITTNSATN